MPRIETVKIKDDSHPCGYVVINKCDMKECDKPYVEHSEEKPKQSRRSRKKD